jgi:hypothetical protein
MQIDWIQTESVSLAAFGIDAAKLLRAGNIHALVEQFGYARALGRDCADAVRADLATALAELGATKLVSADSQEPRVSYYKANDTGLFALVECLVPAENGKSVLLELVVTTDGTSTHITLEDLSCAA